MLRAPIAVHHVSAGFAVLTNQSRIMSLAAGWTTLSNPAFRRRFNHCAAVQTRLRGTLGLLSIRALTIPFLAAGQAAFGHCALAGVETHSAVDAGVRLTHLVDGRPSARSCHGASVCRSQYGVQEVGSKL